MSVFAAYLEPEDWRLRAACRGLAPADGTKAPHPFFPESKHVERDVVAICEDCPVRAECEEAGVDQVGVWGGKSQRARSRGRWDADERRSKQETLDRRRRIHQLSAQGETGERIGLAVGLSRRNVVKHLQIRCEMSPCWCTKQSEATG